ncbi:hypothetical protein Q1695_007749 [Nippostrongylus brasiliensis]|nr:hypothetical protein Q1695_007749 [Nippostrongylus brasiliensis]
MLVDIVLLTVKLLALIVSQYLVVFACIVTHNDENEIILRQIPGRSTPSWSRRPPTGTTRVGMTTSGPITPCCPRTVPPRMFDMPRQTEEPSSASTASEETPTTSDDYKSTTAPIGGLTEIGGVPPQTEMGGVASPTEGTAAQQAAAGGVTGPTGAGAVQQAAGAAAVGPTGDGVGGAVGPNGGPAAQQGAGGAVAGPTGAGAALQPWAGAVGPTGGAAAQPAAAGGAPGPTGGGGGVAKRPDGY